MSEPEKRKRSFGFDTSSLSTAVVLLEEGFYAGELINVGVTRGEGEEFKQNIEIKKERKWDKANKVMVELDNYIITGWLSFGALLTSKKAIKLLQRDEPKIFGGMINLSFDKESLTLLDNPTLGAWLAALELHEINFGENVDWEYDEDILIPEELAAVPNIVDMMNSLAYQRQLFSDICIAASGARCKVKVVKQPNYKNKEVLENSIGMGNSNAPFCGILPYVEGCEEDLGD